MTKQSQSSDQSKQAKKRSDNRVFEAHVLVERRPKDKTKTNRQRRRLVGVMYRPMCKILILIGVATLLLSLVTVWQYRSATRRTSSTDGTITAITKVSGVGKDERGIDNQKCRLSYKLTVDGQEYTDALGYRGNPTTDKCKLSISDTIPVKYDANHPANNSYAVDDQLSDHATFDDTLKSTIGMAIVGLIPLAIGIFGLHIANNEYSRARDAARKAKSAAHHGKDKAVNKTKAIKAKVVKKAKPATKTSEGKDQE